MYKRYSIQQLRHIKTECFQTLTSMMKKEGVAYFKQLLNMACNAGTSTTYFQKSTPLLRLQKTNNQRVIFDEREKIEIHLNNEDINNIHTMLKNTKKIDRLMKTNKSIQDTLWDEFQQGLFQQINGKPYLVYDIETTFATHDLKQAKFIIWYAISTANDQAQFNYIDQDSCQKFFEYLKAFDGYIVGYNNIAFDNPVMVYNTQGTQEDIDLLNQKSVDPFLFLYHTTGKKRWLNNISQSLIWMTKTLESWKEAEILFKKFQQTGDQKYMNQLKTYCKNDVMMTLLVLLYLLKYQNFYHNNQEYKFQADEFLIKAQMPMSKSLHSWTDTTDKNILFKTDS